jgi:hypothetical protein
MAPNIAFTLKHITSTFEEAERSHPDLMEPYSTRLGEAETNEEKLEIMRAGLRETIKARWPARERAAAVEVAHA